MKLTIDQLISWFFTAVIAAEMFPADSETKVREALAKAPKKERRGLARGMKQGMNDLLGGISLWAKADAVNAALKARGLPGLEEMERQMNKTEDKMLRRGVIKNDEEFYSAKELLDNLESGLTERQRLKVSRMVHIYEEKTRTA